MPHKLKDWLRNGYGRVQVRHEVLPMIIRAGRIENSVSWSGQINGSTPNTGWLLSLMDSYVYAYSDYGPIQLYYFSPEERSMVPEKEGLHRFQIVSRIPRNIVSEILTNAYVDAMHFLERY